MITAICFDISCVFFHLNFLIFNLSSSIVDAVEKMGQSTLVFSLLVVYYMQTILPQFPFCRNLLTFVSTVVIYGILNLMSQKVKQLEETMYSEIGH